MPIKIAQRKTPMRKEYVNIKEAAQTIGVCYRTLKNAMDNGIVPYRKLGPRKYLLSLEALQNVFSEAASPSSSNERI